MNKKLKLILLIECLSVLVFLYCFLVPTEKKNELYLNRDISDYNSRKDIPWTGLVNNNRNVSFHFSLSSKKLYGVVLFFKSLGDLSEGTVRARLFCDDHLEAETTVDVKDILTLQDQSAATADAALKGKELLFRTGILDGECTLVLSGEDIPEEGGITFFANHKPSAEVRFETESPEQTIFPLFIIEDMQKVYPHRWAASMALVLVLFFGYLLTAEMKERSEDDSKC